MKHMNIRVAEKDDCDEYLANRINELLVRKTGTNVSTAFKRLFKHFINPLSVLHLLN